MPAASADKSGHLFTWPQAILADRTSSLTLVGGDEVPVPKGLTRYEAEVRYSFSYQANCWAFVAVAGAGADFWIEINKGDGTSETSLTSIFSILSYVAHRQRRQRNGTRTVRVPFTRDGTDPGVVGVMAGVSAHAEAAAITAYAGVLFSSTVDEICVKSL